MGGLGLVNKSLMFDCVSVKVRLQLPFVCSVCVQVCDSQGGAVPSWNLSRLGLISLRDELDCSHIMTPTLGVPGSARVELKIYFISQSQIPLHDMFRNQHFKVR